jgi:hypothetical protein
MTKTILSLSLLFTLGAFFFIGTAFETTPSATGKYVGVEGCTKACHKTESQGKQLDIWKSSKHSQAWTALETEAADKIAKEKGFTTAAKETPACIKCHVLGKDIDPAELTETFKKEDGVQCETCHGAGSEYKSISVMKDKAKAIENGLLVPADAEAFCKTCHNADSPSYKEFNFATAWESIKHKKP